MGKMDDEYRGVLLCHTEGERERERAERSRIQYNHICLITFRRAPVHGQRDSTVCAHGRTNFTAGRHSTHVNYANKPLENK